MNREAFKQRMQNLKSYREQNPGKGYWDFKSYEDGGEVPPTNKPTIVEPIPYKGKLYSDRYGKKYTEEQVYDYYNNRHKWFSPELSKEEIALLSDPDYFTKEDLKDILNTLILNYINLEDLIDDQLGRTGNDNATVSDTKLQGRRDTHKEEEQREIQCSKEENR